MILLRVRGGLGNQMFQYAFGRAEALRLKTSLALDLTWYRRADRLFGLDRFSVLYRTLIRSRFVVAILKTCLPRTRIYDGFWEDQSYAAGIRAELLKEFTFKKTSLQFQELAATLTPDSIAVHVRRGDYLATPDKYILSYTYYDTAVRHIIREKNLTSPRIIIFSDDKEWCRQEMQVLGGLPATVLDDPAISDAEELILMSRCGHNVIANSTFSWWAAFLNQNTGAMITAPQTWYVNPARNTEVIRALILPEWIVIQ